MTRAISVTLKIPDNEAYTALVALRRLGVDAHHVERGDIYLFDDGGDVESLRRRVIADETIFNPNKHRLIVLDAIVPRAGEVWIEPLSAGGDTRRVAVAWRLFDAHGEPVAPGVLEAATDRLLCNPAIDRAIFRGSTDRDIPSGPSSTN
jgi:hypothetical protein